MSNSLPTKVRKFREHYRKHHQPSRYNGYLHFSFSMLFALSCLLFSTSQLDNVSLVEWITIPLTFIYANLVEYLVHRFPMHRPIRKLKLLFRRHARQHHRFFTEKAMQFDNANDFAAVLFPPYLIFFFLVFFAIPAGLILAYLTTTNIAFLFAITAFAYFINYEIFHTIYHLADSHWIYKFPFMKSLRELHLHHHNQKLMSHFNFNITYPISDWLFGTYYRKEREQDKTQTDKTVHPA
ncbi:sterol desaturase family protein [Aliikangiella sp. G2MR2-5]|uniref:sterol desaturase family protein n=1 Tax=Aliikangiella sp. G2MR2-5 TaxID=2788943 RepID=UPI0018ABEC47|nr:sterol desaturase family protein [Aliikangiella sp. G2MR2-5]